MRWRRLEDGLEVLAPAKINLYLEVGGLRSDGFHDIDSVFQAVTLYDRLEIHETSDGRVVLEEEGIQDAERNLVHRAGVLLQKRRLPAGSRKGARIRLTKQIPQGGGLGGGSSDAAATLLGLSRIWGVPVGPGDLAPLAAELGSDVPFFLVGGTARCRGRGEIVESWSEAFDDSEPFHYVLAYPRLNVSTRSVYDRLDASRGPGCALTPPSPLDSMRAVEVRVELRRGRLFFNRFEEVVLGILPELRRLHETLSEQRFVKVLMTGSGSTMYGLCRSADEASDIAGELRGRVEADLYAVASESCRGGFGEEATEACGGGLWR